MFQQLSDQFLGAIKKIRGQSKITEGQIEDVLKDIRLSLLASDVHFKVVKKFIDDVKAKALGLAVGSGLSVPEAFTKIVYDELVQILGTDSVALDCTQNPSTILMVGLQGVGKTTTSAKLALFARKSLSKRTGLVSTDVYRPAAREQLRLLAKQINAPIFEAEGIDDPVTLATSALAWAKQNSIEALIVDTAGRLQIDQDMMAEVQKLKEILNPTEVLLVADSLLGSQAVTVALTFHERLKLTGLILTKMDGDARGGAALSIREVTGVPIKFFGEGEKVADLSVFHPDRLAKRLLDMGDIMTLVEKAQSVVTEQDARDASQKMKNKSFSLDDFLKQIQMLKKMGGFESIMKFIPGMKQISKQLGTMAPPDDELRKIEAIIRSMTPRERRNTDILNGSRRLRIAKGSGTQVQDVNKLVRQFEEARKMMSQMIKMGMKI